MAPPLLSLPPMSAAEGESPLSIRRLFHSKFHTFQDEFRMFLKKYGVEYDEADVWD
jgi:hypothetical protein